jgi:hypothetical protein
MTVHPILMTMVKIYHPKMWKRLKLLLLKKGSVSDVGGAVWRSYLTACSVADVVQLSICPVSGKGL